MSVRSIIDVILSSHPVAVLTGDTGSGRTTMVQRALDHINTTTNRKYRLHVFDTHVPETVFSTLLLSRQVDGFKSVILIKSYEHSPLDQRRRIETYMHHIKQYENVEDVHNATIRNPMFLQVTINDDVYDPNIRRLLHTLPRIHVSGPSIIDKLTLLNMVVGHTYTVDTVPPAILQCKSFHEIKTIAQSIQDTNTDHHEKDTFIHISMLHAINRVRMPLLSMDRTLEGVEMLMSNFDEMSFIQSLQLNPITSNDEMSMSRLSCFMDTLSEWDTLPYNNAYGSCFVRMASASLGFTKGYKTFETRKSDSGSLEILKTLQESSWSQTSGMETTMSVIDKYEMSRFLHLGDQRINNVMLKGFEPVSSSSMSSVGQSALNRQIREKFLRLEISFKD